MSNESPATDAMSNETLTRIFSWLGGFIVQYRLFVLVAIAAITGLMISFIPSLILNNDGRIYFIQGDPMLEAQDRFEETFGSEQIVMFFFESDELFTKEGYAAIDALLKGIDALDYKGQKAFSATLDPFHAPALKPGSGSINIGPILESENPTDEEIARAKELVTHHPIYSRSIVNPQGTIGAVIATMIALPGDQEYTDFIADAVKDLEENTPGLEKLNTRLVGPPVFGREMNIVTAREAVLFGSLSVLVCLFVLFFMFRKIRQVLAAVSTVIVATIWSVGAMAGLGVEMSLIHTILPPAVIVTGLGMGIHVINEYRLLVDKTGRQEAIIASVAHMGAPSMLTAITTAIGFLAMLTAPVNPMRTLGMFIALGVLLAFSLSITMVPAILALRTKPGEDPQPADGLRQTSDVFFARLADFVVGNKKAVAVGFAMLASALTSGVMYLEFDTNFLHALRSDHPFRQTVEYVDEKMGGSSSMELIIDTGVKGGIHDPEFLARLNKLQRWVEANEKDVVWVTLSIGDLMKEISLAFSGKRVLPETRAAAAELLFLYEIGGGATRNVIDKDKRLARMSCRTRAISSGRSSALEAAIRGKAEELFGDLRIKAFKPETVEEAATPRSGDGDDDDLIIIEDEDDAVVDDGNADAKAAASGTEDDDEIIIIDDDDDNVPGIDGADSNPPPKAPVAKSPAVETVTMTQAPTIEIAGSTPLFAKLNEYVIESQQKSFLLAAFIIGIIMMLMLRSITLGLAVMIPNILPILSTYGLMGWLGVPVDFMSSVIAVAAIGVAVDGTIHIGTRYKRARAEGLNAPGAARAVMTSVGRALVVTTVGLMCGFIVLAPSIMVTLAVFGVFMAFCLLLALLYDLLMTPAVLAWLNPGD